MYTTKPLSLLRRSPELLNSRPKDGPNLGYLVMFDEECETTVCFGLCKDRTIRDLPFPQNKDLTTSYSSGSGEHRTTSHNDVVFIPVLNQPLSSNRYYVICREGKHKGKASVSSMEDDVETFCCCTFIKDAKPKPLDPSDIYQQVEIVQKKHRGFTAMSVAQDGIPPVFLRRKHWSLDMRTPRHYQLEEAPGLNSALRAKLPEINGSNAVVVGKWYVPFMFVNEDFGKLKEQMKKSMFYEVTLEQRWDKIFECDNSGGRVVHVDTVVDKEEAFVDGNEVVCDWNCADNGVVWFKNGKEGESKLLGLSALVVERMKWEQERVGFSFSVGDFKKIINVKRTEEAKGEWTKFDCYVLVERFVFKRMDESVLLTHDFKHIHQIRCIWA